MEQGKVCRECKEWKPYSDFYICPSFTDGYQNRCRPCHRAFKRSRPPKTELPALPAGHQRCNRCKYVKPLEEYHADSRKPLGRQYMCKVCVAAGQRESYQRRKAIAVAAPAYDPNTSKPCPNCLETKPLEAFAKSSVGVAASWCKQCVKERREEKAADPQTYENYRLYNKAFRLRRVFGLTVEQYDKMLADQNGVCAICKRPETTIMNGRPIRIAVDHDHETGHVRGLLCRRCNTAIGLLEHDSETLRAAISYLEASNPRRASDS